MTTEPVDVAKRGALREALPFPVLVDPDFRLADALGLRHEGAGKGGADTFFATAYLIGPDGVVRKRFAPENWRVRADPEEIVEALR